MLQTKQITINEQLNRAKDQLSKKDDSIQVSVVEKIDYVNPVDFFAAFENEDVNRVFWKDATDEIYFVGIDIFESFQASTENRFETVRDLWTSYVNDMYIANDLTNRTGPLLLGGFSFNKKITGDKWKQFQPGLMILPKLMLTVDRDSCYMTYNLNLSHDTDINETSRELKQWHQKLKSMDKLFEHQSVKSTNSLDYRNWDRLINEAVDSIKRGKLGKIVLARELEATFNQEINLSHVLQRLVDQQRDSFIYILDQDEESFISATPERLVRVEGNELLSTCLAGTISRGETSEEDEVLAWKLLNDQKNLSEHQYVVNMIKEAIQPLTHSIHIPEKPVIYPLRTLQHLYTPVTATLKEANSIFDLIAKLHPTPALGGEPRELAMEFISEKEPFERGWYAAPIGWVGHQGNGEFAVAIRSALIHQFKATLFAGCGIVEESNPKSEFEETKLKFTPMLEALGGISR